jgi:hypothetical protein
MLSKKVLWNLDGSEEFVWSCFVRDAKLAQIGVEESGEVVVVHGGVYQASRRSAGRDGVGR